MATALMLPDATVVEQHALTVLEQATALTIQTAEQYVAAAELLKAVKATQAEIAATFDPAITAAHAAHKATLAAKAKHFAPTEQAERLIKDKLRDYDEAQERIRQEEARRLAEEARRAEETRRVAEAAALEREAVATGDASLLAEAEAIISEPVVAPVVIVPKATPTVAGISYRETWKAEVTDLAQLVRAAATNPTLIALLQPNTTAINGMARALKGTMRVPGVRVYSERGVAAGGGR